MILVLVRTAIRSVTHTVTHSSPLPPPLKIGVVHQESNGDGGLIYVTPQTVDNQGTENNTFAPCGPTFYQNGDGHALNALAPLTLDRAIQIV